MSLVPPIMPYSAVVGQQEAKLALEVAYVEPRVRGVLLSGERGTAKSTLVRAFSQMMHGAAPVVIPINATEDRVVGGWSIPALMDGKAVPQKGLLEEADGRILFIDEVNLLDDHVVNILLDVTSTGILEVQREGRHDRVLLAFTLVGTMNPEEGGLRPQLLDRFGLMVAVRTEPDLRADVLRSVLAYEDARANLERGGDPAVVRGWTEQDAQRRARLEAARRARPAIRPEIVDLCVELAKAIQTDGTRGEGMLALAARACAAIEGAPQVEVSHLRKVAPLALQHRQKGASHRHQDLWGKTQTTLMDDFLA